MAWVHLILFVAVLAPVLIVQNCCAVKGLYLPDEYLDLPKADQFHLPLHVSVRKALLGLEVTPESTVEDIKERITSLSRSVQIYSIREAYQSMEFFFVDADDSEQTQYCPDYFEVLKSIIAQVKTDANANPPGELSHLSDFITFQSNLRGRADKCEESKTVESMIEKFTPLFIAGLEFEPTRDRSFYKQLVKLDMAEDNLNARKMIAVAKSSTVESKLKDESLEPLVSFMDYYCKPLHNDKVDTLILAKALTNRPYDLRTTKIMFEYRRICLAWENTDSHDKIMRNLEKLNASYWSRLTSCLRCH